MKLTISRFIARFFLSHKRACKLVRKAVDRFPGLAALPLGHMLINALVLPCGVFDMQEKGLLTAEYVAKLAKRGFKVAI